MRKDKKLFIVKDSDNGSILTVVAIDRNIERKDIDMQVEMTKLSNMSRWTVEDIVEDLKTNLDPSLINYDDWATVIA